MDDPNRGEGLHASDIYGSLYEHLEPNRFKRDGAPPDLKMAIGLAWEQYLEKVLILNGVLAARPGELRSPEGILYSPDLLIVNGEDRIGEIKATFMSAAGGVAHPKRDKWFTQVKLYCWWTEIPRARFYALYLCGDYRKNRDPILEVSNVDFTYKELRDNHKLCMNHARSEKLI